MKTQNCKKKKKNLKNINIYKKNIKTQNKEK